MRAIFRVNRGNSDIPQGVSFLGRICSWPEMSKSVGGIVKQESVN